MGGARRARRTHTQDVIYYLNQASASEHSKQRRRGREGKEGKGREGRREEGVYLSSKPQASGASIVMIVAMMTSERA